jgi:hypothetical protein
VTRLLLVLALIAAGCANGDRGGNDHDTASVPTFERIGELPPTTEAPGDDGLDPALTAPDGDTPVPGDPGPAAAGGAGAATADVPPASGTTPSTTSSAPEARAAPRATVYAPPAGRYLYDTTGYSSSGSGATARRQEAPPQSTDDVTVARKGKVTEVRTVTSYDRGRSQETIVEVTAEEARLHQLTFRGTTAAGMATEQAVKPDPPVLLARLPITIGDRWDIVWNDKTLGLQGIGAGEVLRTEAVELGTGTVTAFVIEVHQRIRGTFQGELTATTWLDPSNGVQVKHVIISDLRTATGSSHDEITRVLRTQPR